MPLIFEQYFELGSPETKSPFITKQSLAWGKHLDLKASFLAAALLILSFILYLHGEWLPVSYVLLVAVYYFAGVPSLIESLEDLANFEVNIDVLMTLAAFSSVFIGTGFEGGLLLVLFAISGAMEEAVREKAASSINALHKLQPKTALVIGEGGELREVAVKDVTLKTRLLIRSGQVVPLDGSVVKGETSVNLVHITGENFPVRKVPGNEVLAGSRNLEGVIEIEVTRTHGDSTLAKIIELVTKAQSAKPELERWFDKVINRYAMTIIALAFLFSMGLPFIVGIPFLGQEGSLYRSLAFLIAASPCALIIAVPIAYLSAVSASAKKGILLKGATSLDALVGCKKIAFDKTGTLTTGELELVAIEPLENFERDQALAVAASMERGASHPIAKAICKRGQEEGAGQLEVAAFRTIPGWGVEGKVAGERVFVGLPEYVQGSLDASLQREIEARSKEIRERGELIALLVAGQATALFRFRDKPRSGVKETVAHLQGALKIPCVMLTGDHLHTARAIAEELGIAEWHADLRPEDKLEMISKLSNAAPLAMVGDGVNDAPALARANVGISMGKGGTEAAMDASDIVFLQDSIELLDWLVVKARKTRRIVVENLLISSVAICFASLPALAGVVPLWLAVVLHEGGTILVGLNGLRLLRD